MAAMGIQGIARMARSHSSRIGIARTARSHNGALLGGRLYCGSGPWPRWGTRKNRAHGALPRSARSHNEAPHGRERLRQRGRLAFQLWQVLIDAGPAGRGSGPDRAGWLTDLRIVQRATAHEHEMRA